MALPMSVHSLVNSRQWQGGDLVCLKNEVQRPSAAECVVNAPWMEPILEFYPEKAYAFKNVYRSVLTRKGAWIIHGYNIALEGDMDHPSSKHILTKGHGSSMIPMYPNNGAWIIHDTSVF